MKKIIYLTLIILGFSACQNKENHNIILSGTIKNMPGDTIFLYDVYQKNKQAIVVDSTKHFADTLNLKKGYYKLKVAQQYTWLFLKPGDRLQLSTDYKDFDNQLKYKGKGAIVNNYLAQKILLDQKLKRKTGYQYYAGLDETSFVKLLDSIGGLYDNLLKPVENKNFQKLERLLNNFKRSRMLVFYPAAKRYFSGDTTFKVSKNFPEAYQGIKIDDSMLYKLPDAVFHIGNYIDYQVKKDIKDDDNSSYNKMLYVSKNVKNQEFINEFAYQLANYDLMYTKDVDKFYALFDKIEKNPEYKAKIKTKYDNIKALQPGAPSPDFTAYDINGKEYHLKDFAGKPLYIDLWATWCGPCRREIPFLDKIKEQYKDKPINFLSFDVYDDKNKWEQMVKQQKMTGWQLINTDRNLSFLKKYVVDGIPRFILLDKDGKIVDANAPRPSDKTLISLLDKTIGSQ